MSKTAHAIDRNAADLIRQTDADRAGSSLLAPSHLEVLLERVRNDMVGLTRVDNVDVPRYGVLSLILQSTPCFVYGHPALKRISKTAFTDGIHVFICDEFLEKIEKDAEDSKYAKLGLEPLLLHELMHKTFNHTRRLREFPPDVRNEATDKSINARLVLGYPDVQWVPTLSETGLAFRAGETERYAKLSEDTIAREIMAERLRKDMKKQEERSKQGQQGQQPQQGQGQDQGGQQPGQQPGQGQKPGPGRRGQQPQGKMSGAQKQEKQEGGGQPGGQQGPGGHEQGDEGQGGQPGGQNPGGRRQPQNQPGGRGQKRDQGSDEPGEGPGAGGDEEASEPSDEFGGEGDNHFIDPADLIRVLEEQGLDAVKQKLGLPDSDDLEAIGELQQADEMRQMEAIQQAEVQRQRVGDKYPGAHIADAASEHVRARSKGKMTWRLAVRQQILDNGQKWRPSMEEPSDLYYVDEMTDVLGTELYLPVELNHKNDEVVLCLIDTSGSVHTTDIQAFLAEIFELKMANSGASDSASEVVVLSADTVLRGEPVEINESNAQELMDRGIAIHGRGGTDFAEPLRQAGQLKMFKEKKIRSVVYFTDLFAHVPKFSELGLAEGTAVLFVAAPSTSESGTQVEEFAKAVEDWARVVEIKEGVEADLSDTFQDQAVSPKKRRPKP